jgi:hypothetical protein
MYNDWKRNRALPVSISISVIILVAASTAQLSGTPVRARYSTNFEEAASLANSCSGEQSPCISNNVQTEGENNVPTVLVSGPPGPAGPKQELQVREVFSELQDIPSGGSGAVEAKCASDEIPTGGGTSLSRTVNESISTSGESDSSTASPGWEYEFKNINSKIPVKIGTFVECAKLVDAP